MKTSKKSGFTTAKLISATQKPRQSATANTEKKQKTLNHKFKAIACERHGIKFPSKLERSYYDLLNQLQKAGKVLFFLRQVGFDLPGNKRYFADFMVFYSNGEVEIVDTKGVDTSVSKLKRDQVENLYPVTIQIVKKL